MKLIERFGRGLARYLSRPADRNRRMATCRPEQLASTLKKGDVLLVEGTGKFGTAIKYLTQSTWSHAALCITEGRIPQLIEADILDGVRLVGLDTYWQRHTRICRPVGLTSDERDQLVDVALARVGHQYDTRNVIDLARFLIPTPPVPARFRRRLLSLGSGDPTRAICSSLIAQAFQAVRYPILPEIIPTHTNDPACVDCVNETWRIRHYTLFAPRDFDISPYFQVVKPTLEIGFDPHDITWESGYAPIG